MPSIQNTIIDMLLPAVKTNNSKRLFSVGDMQ